MVGRILIIFVLAASMAGYWRVAEKVWKNQKESYEVSELPKLVNFDKKMVKLIFLGHHGIFQDYLYLYSLEQLLNKNVNEKNFEAVHTNLLKIAEFGAGFESFYTCVCIYFAYYYKRPELCESVTRSGIKEFPNSHYIPFFQGIVSGQTMQDWAVALKYATYAASRPQAPESYKKYAQKLLRDGSMTPEELVNSLNQLVDDKENGLKEFILKLQEKEKFQ